MRAEQQNPELNSHKNNTARQFIEMMLKELSKKTRPSLFFLKLSLTLSLSTKHVTLSQIIFRSGALRDIYLTMVKTKTYYVRLFWKLKTLASDMYNIFFLIHRLSCHFLEINN
jgi:hypothetical protein